MGLKEMTAYMELKEQNKLREVEEYKGYEISECGKVFSLKYPGHQMKAFRTRLGYMCIPIRNIDGSRRHMYVHRLVALCFVPRPSDNLEVHHIDSDPGNNHASNLQWITHAENIQLGYIRKNGRLKPKHKKHIPKLTDQQVQEIRKSKALPRWEAYKYGVSAVYIYKIRRGERKTTKFRCQKPRDFVVS